MVLDRRQVPREREGFVRRSGPVKLTLLLVSSLDNFFQKPAFVTQHVELRRGVEAVLSRNERRDPSLDICLLL
jgi:hypothetical protein